MKKEQSDLPLVTVLIMSYNHEKFIRQCVESIVNQTYKNIKFFMIDDGSTDKTPEILEELSKKYNFTFWQQKNKGVCGTVNDFLAHHLEGKYFAPMASDDFCEPTKIEKLVQAFEQLDDSYAVVCGNAHFVDEAGKLVYINEKWEVKHDPKEGIGTFIERYLLHRNDVDINKNFGQYETFIESTYLPMMSILIKSKALVDCGGFDEDLLTEDIDIFLKLSKDYKFKYLDEVLAYYRQHGTNVTKVLTRPLIKSLFKLLLREKEYAFANGHKHLWIRSYYLILKRTAHYSKEYKLFFKYFFKLSPASILYMMRKWRKF